MFIPEGYEVLISCGEHVETILTCHNSNLSLSFKQLLKSDYLLEVAVVLIIL